MIVNQTGVTLIELLLVISIIFIMVVLFNSGIRNLLESLKLRADFRKLYTMFLKARQLTIIKQKPYGIFFNQEQRAYTLFCENGSDIKTIDLKNGINYHNGDIVFGGDKKMTFKPLGTAEGGHVSICNKLNENYKIIVSGLTGRVRYEK